MLIDTVCSEYGWSLEVVMEMPLAIVFALYAAINERYGNKPRGLSYTQAELVEIFTGDPP